MLHSKSSGFGSGVLPGGAVVPQSKILEKVEAQRTEINDLQAKVASLEEKQIEYEQTLSCVDRQWTQINEDIIYMSRQAKEFAINSAINSESETSTSGRDHVTGNGVVANAIQDPFLQRLVRKDVATAKKVSQKAKELMKDAPEVEKELILRAESTKEHLAQLFDLQESYHKRLTDCLHLAGQNADQSALQEQLERVTAEAEAARQEAHAQKALSRTLQEQQRLADDESLQQEATIKDLRNELADKEVALQNAQRKLFQARASSEADAASAAAASAAVAAVKQELTPVKQEAADAKSGPSEIEQEAQEQLAKRDAELAKERAACLKLQREVQELQSRMASHAQVTQSPIFQAVQQQMAELREQLAMKQKERHDLDLKLADAQHRMHMQDRQLRDAEATRELLREAQQRTAQLQADLMQTRQDAQQASMAYQQERACLSNTQMVQDLEALQVEKSRMQARLSNTQTVQDLLKLTETLQAEKSRLQGREQKDGSEKQRLQQALTDVRAATSKLKEREYELENVLQRLAGKDAQIAASQRAEEIAIARARDMELFVQVLLNYSDDPRDMSEIRASEARYRALADSLRSKLDGQEHQAKLDALRQREAKADERAAAMEKENTALKVQAAESAKRAEELQEELSACKAESAEYLKEIDSLAMEFDWQQEAIKALVADVRKREEVDAELVTERIRASQAAAQHRIEQQNSAVATAAAEKKAATAAQRIAQLQAELQASQDGHAALQRHEAALAAQLEAARQDGKAAQDALRLKQMELDAAQEAAAERRKAAEQEAEELAKERQKRQRTEEDMKAKIAKLAVGSPGGPPGSSSAQAWEVENMRERLYCQVCNSRRQKDRVIKCGHAFCSTCIDAMGKARQRLCPGCQSKFDHRADVRPLYL